MATGWSGKAVVTERAHWAALLPAPCAQCGKLIHPDPPGTLRSGWVIGHKLPRVTHPELTWVRANMQLEHRRCSDKTGQAGVISKAKADLARELGISLPKTKNNEFAKNGKNGDFSRRGVPTKDSALSRHTHPRAGMSGVSEPESFRSLPWMADLLDIPPDAAWPRAMSPAHPAAVGSYGAEAEEWLRAETGVSLRWWQRLATRRQLEHDDQGRLVWQNIIESTPRRAGKSVRLRGMALWRTGHADLFGEQQLALHTGKDLPICKEIHRRAWGWADEHGWAVRRQAGNEEIEAPDGSRWIVRGRTSVYGYDVTLGMVDEAWGVESSVVDDGLEPAMLERIQPQLVLTSTAHRRATSLMRRRLSTAVAGLGADWSTLLLWWGAPDDADIEDQAAWRAASPHWSAQRRDLIGGKLSRARRGEADPEADDPDPLEGFKAQYLNVWPAAFAAQVEPGEPVFEDAEWAALGGGTVTAAAVAAVEAWFSDGLAVALAKCDGPRVVVSVRLVESAAAAADLVVGVPRVLVGKSLLRDPAFALLEAQGMSGTARSAVMELRRLADEGALAHDGSACLTEQVLALRTTPASDGPRLRSSSRADAVKAAAWAAAEARMFLSEPAIF